MSHGLVVVVVHPFVSSNLSENVRDVRIYPVFLATEYKMYLPLSSGNEQAVSFVPLKEPKA